MKFVVVTLLLVALAVCAYAQTVKGTVKDTTGKVIPYATVSLKNSESNVIVTYAAANSRGIFALQLPANTAANSLTIEVHSIGYKTAVKNIVSFNTTFDFTLTLEPNQLQEVIVKNSRPVLRTNGDTLGYKVSDLSSLQDRTIGDVIKKLPGITVDANGTIRYYNKPISSQPLTIAHFCYKIAAACIPMLRVTLTVRK